jgi:hypothetical protein
MKKIFLILLALVVLIFPVSCEDPFEKIPPGSKIQLVLDIYIVEDRKMDDAGLIIATDFATKPTKDGWLVWGKMRMRPNLDDIGPEMREILTKMAKVKKNDHTL